MTRWMHANLGPDVPLHFSAFHADFRMRDKPPTLPETLTHAREIALGNGLRYVYTGNVRDPAGGSTNCVGCGNRVVGRDGYEITAWNLTDDGHCTACGGVCPGVFAGVPGGWGSRRLPLDDVGEL
jgi:pyruvate formate lyase activating enzyme